MQMLLHTHAHTLRYNGSGSGSSDGSSNSFATYRLERLYFIHIAYNLQGVVVARKGWHGK